MRSRASAIFAAIVASCALFFPWAAQAQGQTLWSSTFGCGGCHDVFTPAYLPDTPDNLRRNTGNTRAVIDSAISNNAGGWMGRYKSVSVDGVDGAEPVTATQRNSLVAFIGGFVSTATATVAYHGSTSVTLRDMSVLGSTV